MNNFWKALGLTIILLTIGIESFSQERSVTIGYYNEVTTYFPIDRNANYSRWEGIYTAEEIGTQDGYLKGITFYWKLGYEDQSFSNIKIYAKLITSRARELGDDTTSTSGYTLIYSGNTYHRTGENIRFDVTSPFYYNGSDNLQLMIEYGYQGVASTPVEWVIFPTEKNQSRWASSNSEIPSMLYATSSKPKLTIDLGCLFAYAGDDQSLCPGKSVRLGGDPTATGQNTEFSYQWNGESSVLSSTEVANPVCTPSSKLSNLTYTITVTSKQCESGVTSNPVKVEVCDGRNIIIGKKQKATTCGEISFYDSGNSGGDYAYNEDYKLTVYPCDENHSLVVTFSSFDLEASNNCDRDWLKIYNGTSENDPLLGTFCGTSIESQFTANNTPGALTFVFHSDEKTTGNGWVARFNQELKSCDLIKGTASISSSGDYVHSGSATINLTGYTGTFGGWEYSYNGVDYLPIANSTPSWNTFNNTVTYYRAKILDPNATCYSDAVKYNTSRNFYINDNSTVGDQWCTAVGNINNHALSPDKPITGMNPLMNKYSLNQGDTIFWDAGSYAESGLVIDDTIVSGNPVCILGSDSMKTKFNMAGLPIRFANNVNIYKLYLENTKLSMYFVKNMVIQNCSIGALNFYNTTGKTEYITIKNNYFNFISTYRACITNAGYEMSDIVIDSNIFIKKDTIAADNYYGIDIQRYYTQSSETKNIRIRHNYFGNFQKVIHLATQMTVCSNIIIQNNIIDNKYLYPGLNAGIQLMNIKSSSASPMIVEGNRIRGYQYSVYSEGVENARINSNFLSLSKTGLFSAGNKQVSILNNSFSNTLSNINFGTGNNTGIKVLNNIFSIESDSIQSDTGTCIITGSQDTLTECNYNLYYGTGTAQIAKYNGSIISSLESWKRQNHSLSGGDGNSLFGNPGFTDVSAGDLTICDNSPAYQKGSDILEPICDIGGTSAQSPFSIGAHLKYIPAVKNGPYAVLKKKLDGGYHYSKGLYLQLKYTEEYNPGTNAKLKFRVFDQNHEEIFVSSWNQPYTGIKYGDNYLSIYKVGCENNHAMHLPDGYYLLEVSNDKNEKWYLRFYSKIEPAEQAVAYPCPTSNQIPSGYTLKTL